jgi:HPt (histidine-containing phosphotransfer) domain-containing protein
MKIKETEMPVICISAAAVNEDWQKYRDAGMNAFLPKPFTEAMLLTTILSVIKDYGPSVNAGVYIEERTGSAPSGKINLQNLYHISGGDDKFVKQMLLSFIDSTERGLNDMQSAVISGQWESAADLAHKLIPPCRHIGASDLCSFLKNIEEIIQKKDDPGNIEPLVGKSLIEFGSIRELLRDHMEKIS